MKKNKRSKSITLDTNDAVRGKPHLDIDRVFHEVENKSFKSHNRDNRPSSN